MAWFLPAAMLASSVVSAFSADRTNKKQISAADRQMDFQSDMSNTAHQREIKDLTAAGLNPILSAKYGGASTPTGAMPTIRDLAEGLTSNALQAAKIKEEIGVLREQKGVLTETKRKVTGEADVAENEGAKARNEKFYENSWQGRSFWAALRYMMKNTFGGLRLFGK